MLTLTELNRTYSLMVIDRTTFRATTCDWDDLQDAYLWAVDNLDNFDAERGNVVAWLVHRAELINLHRRTTQQRRNKLLAKHYTEMKTYMDEHMDELLKDTHVIRICKDLHLDINSVVHLLLNEVCREMNRIELIANTYGISRHHAYKVWKTACEYVEEVNK